MKLSEKDVCNWWKHINHNDFLYYTSNIDINEFVIENNERVVYFEDGNRYIPHAQRMGENDGKKQKEIIEELASLGVEFTGKDAILDNLTDEEIRQLSESAKLTCEEDS